MRSRFKAYITAFAAWSVVATTGIVQDGSPTGYYDTARGLIGLPLKAALATRIKGQTCPTPAARRTLGTL